MSIEKKSLISTLKTTKKANVVAAPAPEGSEKITKTTKLARKQRVLRKQRMLRKQRTLRA
ncbi:MAG TPA: hypothetical protein VKB90_01710 [Candidatus Acidoferrum sp.]|nr:hypothetical protein [Candidatus Acidoferrum sp.]